MSHLALRETTALLGRDDSLCCLGTADSRATTCASLVLTRRFIIFIFCEQGWEAARGQGLWRVFWRVSRYGEDPISVMSPHKSHPALIAWSAWPRQIMLTGYSHNHIYLIIKMTSGALCSLFWKQTTHLGRNKPSDVIESDQSVFFKWRNAKGHGFDPREHTYW